ncbi:MAG: bifunctional [glutamate--ammonia ligase]-adenylyl-L-tyrosine phosphorylase/[glutamate--ammonia-ligase] adenylyltransferase [Desulfosalsimonadaceae bacterium]
MPEASRIIPGPEALSEPLYTNASQGWEKFCASCEKAGQKAPQDPETASALKLAFAFSGFVGKQAERDPDLACDLAASGDIVRSCPPGCYPEKLGDLCEKAGTEEELMALLRRFRNREMLRIAVRDLAGRADLFETMQDLSALAEACIDFAADWLYQCMAASFGYPEDATGALIRPVVLGVGKLGGRELNFSSDVDLLFAFSEAGRTKGKGRRPISHEEFFSKLYRRLVNVLSKNSPEGFVFRVDVRLRPYGDSGPIAMSFDAYETYYQEQGRQWERYALIKARPVAGDTAAGERLIQRLRPFVYRRYLDYGTFEDLRDMKRKIVRELDRKGLFGNIKLGAGGIREIEFFGQVFQLIRGGVNPDYQGRRILPTLKRLLDEECIDATVYHQLRDAYVFLRDTEHRLQMAGDRQTHTLPGDECKQLRLAQSMGYADWQGFYEVLAAHMERVHAHFTDLLAEAAEEGGRNPESGHPADELWHCLREPGRACGILAELGFAQPEAVRKVLQQFQELTLDKDVSQRGRERIRRLFPQILQKAEKMQSPETVLERVFELIRSIRRRSCYMALLLENPEALTHLMRLAAASPWIIAFLSCHPLLLDELLDPRSLYVPLGKTELDEEIRARLERVASGDLEQQMDELRIFKQSHTLRIAAADVAGQLPLMKVSDRLTYLAETVIDVVLELSWQHLVAKYGHPGGIAEDGGRAFVVVAYGKLGGYELGYGSDLDLVFLHAASGGYTRGGRLSAIDNHQFYVRLGQRIIHFLSTMTSTGKLYEADLRLRPSGNAGVLVSHMDAFERYEQQEAWTWEHQALIKARPISGDPELGRRFSEVRRQVLTSAPAADLAGRVRDMRERMRKSRGEAKGASCFDIKNDRGGIVDIEFLVQYLILQNAGEHPGLVQWTDVVRQLNSLALAGVIGDRRAHMLKQTYLVFRYLVHRLSLEQKPARIEKDRLAEHRRRVMRTWRQVLKI